MPKSDNSAHQRFAAAQTNSEWDIGKVERVEPDDQLKAAAFTARVGSERHLPKPAVRELLDILGLDVAAIRAQRESTLVSS